MYNNIFNIKENIKIDMKNIKLKGDIIDVGMENYGVIYKLCKESDDELAVEYIMEEKKQLMQEGSYNTAILFFTLSKLFSFTSRRRLLEELCKYLNDSAEVIIWDINKNINTILNLNIEVLLPNDEVKIIKLRDKNLLKKINLRQLRRLVIDYFDIIEEEEKENIIFLRARRKGRRLNEGSVNST